MSERLTYGDVGRPNARVVLAGSRAVVLEHADSGRWPGVSLAIVDRHGQLARLCLHRGSLTILIAALAAMRDETPPTRADDPDANTKD